MSSPKPTLTHRHSRTGSTAQLHSTASHQDPSKLQDPPSTATPDSPSSPSTPSPENDPEPSLPLSMSTSLLLSTTLPPDTTSALITTHAGLDTHKVNVRFQAIGGAPILKQKVFKISASSKFGAVVGFLRKKLAIGQGESLFCYVNSVFAPGLDEGVGNLHRCFKTDDQLIVAYSKTPAFG